MTTPKLFYGIWIPGQGWLKANNEAVAFDEKEVAESTARRVMNNARVEYIDASLVALEPYLLSVEKERAENTWWRRMMKGLHDYSKRVQKRAS